MLEPSEKFMQKLSIGEVEESIWENMIKLLLEYQDILEYDEEVEGRTKATQHEIKIKDGVKPIKQEAAGFNQVEMKEEDKEKTAFVCSKGLFEYNVMPFGLTNAPANISRLMDEILEEYINDFVVVYIDDIMIYSENLEDHMKHIEKSIKEATRE
ncbi:unnamed protein product [Rhizophagus irregularis]|nr:unnamed protein product [Rhizophagus irregularis]